MSKIYITLEEAKEQGFKYICVDGSEHCEELADIQDFMDGYYKEAELMDLDTTHLILNAENIIENECETQEIWDMGEQIPDKAIKEFQEACQKFNEAAHKATTTYHGSGLFIKLTNQSNGDE